MLSHNAKKKSCCGCGGEVKNQVVATEYRMSDWAIPRVLFRHICDTCYLLGIKDRIHIFKDIPMIWGPDWSIESHVVDHGKNLETYPLMILMQDRLPEPLFVYDWEEQDFVLSGSDLSEYSESSEDENDIDYVPPK